jgi:DNA-binding MarR family transcriptional regulator
MDRRKSLESEVVADIQALSAESDQIGRVFAGAHDLSHNDFRALLHVMVAERAGSPLSAGELRDLMGVSGAAITYLVERMTASGHLRREPHPTDRRKVTLRYADHGVAVGDEFFAPLAEHAHRALAAIPDRDLESAHRVLAAVLGAMKDFRTDVTSSRG